MLALMAVLATFGLVKGYQSAGGFHTCYPEPEGSLRCWGDNNEGQLGIGSTSSQIDAPGAAAFANGVTGVSAGTYHTCAYVSGGVMYCWGLNHNGQLGIGSTTNLNAPGAAAISGYTVAVSTGYAHTCAVVSGGILYCWGDNMYGQLGIGSDGNQLNAPGPSAMSSGVATVSAGLMHTCAMMTSGAVYCWGDNSAGQLGIGSTIFLNAPGDAAIESGVVAMTAGDFHTCALVSDGALYCWGSNSNGQLGIGSSENQLNAPGAAAIAANTTLVSTGAGHTCAIMAGGKLYCWGSNRFGQLGVGTTNDVNIPTVVNFKNTPCTNVWAGGQHTCASTSGGAVFCWGMNANGQLGIGNTTQLLTPGPPVEL